MLATRTTIFVVGATYTSPATIQLGARAFTLTSDHATMMGGAPMVSSSPGTTTNVTMRALTLGVPNVTAKSLVVSGSTLTLQDVTIEQPFQVDNVGSLLIESSTIDAAGITSATTSITRSTVHAGITVTGGSLRYDSNHFASSSSVAITKPNTGGDVQVVDSVFVTSGTAPVIAFTDIAKLAFCTFVTTQATSIAAVACAGPAVATISSSIEAWNTLDGGCSTTHSLFAGSSPPGGTGNIAAPVTSIFVDLAGGDYRPNATSAARGQGDPTAPGADHDINGASRPATPDDGAYEVP
ncbi:MAG: hypothetical protein ABJE66_32510 [Deltaproteobacteria bacterium]